VLTEKQNQLGETLREFVARGVREALRVATRARRPYLWDTQHALDSSFSGSRQHQPPASASQ
jgi:hypothetical protein